jgi:hypothetical protein
MTVDLSPSSLSFEQACSEVMNRFAVHHPWRALQLMIR